MYIPVQESCTRTYTVHVSTGFLYWHVLVHTVYVLVHVSTRFLYWHVPCMYEYKILVLVCTWYVLDNILQCKYVSVCTWQGQDNFFEAWCSHPVLKCYRVPSMAHDSISASSISKNTVFTGGSIFVVCTWYVHSTYKRCTWANCYDHVPKTLHFQSS